MVHAAAWSPELSTLSSGALFRIILLSSPQLLDREVVTDPHLAFLVLPQSSSVREAPARYMVAGADACGAVFTTLPQGGGLPPASAGQGPQEMAQHLLRCWELSEWERRFPLLRLLDPGLTTASTSAEVVDQEEWLLRSVSGLNERQARLRPHLEQLYAAWNEPMGETAGMLDRLLSLGSAALSTAGGPLGLCLALASAYPSPEALEYDLEFLERAGLLAPHLPAALSTSRYLLAASPGEGELALDRISLMERMAPGPLLEEPNLWPSLHPMSTFFQARYRAFYTGFHQQHQGQVAQLRIEMEKALPKLLALGRLNSIAELGPVVGEGLEREYHEILSLLNPCVHEELPADDPLCPACGLAALAAPPSARVDSIIHRLDGALAQQQARLSSRAVRQILQSGGPRLEQFLKVLRAGDPSPLVGVLDDEVVAFLRQLLVEGQVITVKSSALTELKQKYPHLEESQIDEALAWLAEELRHSFQAARNQHPGKPVRLTWEP